MSEKLKVVVGASGKVVVQIDEPLGLFVADCSMTDQGADWAALIVRALNGLPEAIAALEDILKHMDGNGMQDWPVAKKASVALYKLKGDQ